MQPTFICKFNNLLVKLSKTPANLLIFHSGNLVGWKKVAGLRPLLLILLFSVRTQH